MEGLLQEVGGTGRFQMQVVAVIKLEDMCLAWGMMQMTFAGLVPDWWCQPHAGVNSSYGNWSRDNTTFHVCPVTNNSDLCHSVVFDESVNTIVSEWDLVCDLSYVKPMITSLQMGGVLVGALMGGQISDSVGRRPTMYAASLANLIVSLVTAFSINWQMFAAMRVLIGVTLGVNVVVIFGYMLEFVACSWRQLVAAIPGWNLGVFLFAFMAWQFPDWSHLHIAVAVLNLPFLLTWPVFPESARWLAVQGRLEKADEVIGQVARVNKRTKPNDTLERLREVMEEERKSGQGRRYTYIDLFRGWRMAFTTLVLSFIWFSLSFCYYGISFGVSALSGNLYFNIFLMAVVEVPACLSCVFFSEKLGRRWTVFLFFILGSLSSFGILLSNLKAPKEKQGDITTGLAMVSKLSVGTAWTVMNTFTSEQYPTVMRNLGYGAANTVARVGGALSPVLINMDTDEEVVRGYLAVGILMASSAFVSLLLGETRGQDLKDSLARIDIESKLVNEGSGSASGWGVVHSSMAQQLATPARPATDDVDEGAVPSQLSHM